MNRTYNLQLVKKPKCDHQTGRCAEEDRPALRRYQGVIGFMRKGHTEAEAIALYDRPRGVCGCGAEVEGRGVICRECKLAQQRAKQAQYRAEKRYQQPKTCKFPGCETVFIGWRRKDYCDTHKYGARPKKYVVKPKPVKVKPKPVKVKPTLPPTWENKRTVIQKLSNDRVTKHIAVKAEPVKVERIVNPGVQVTRIPSACHDSRFTDPAELDPAKARAVAEINSQRGWR